jgi:hypothetical protein
MLTSRTSLSTLLDGIPEPRIVREHVGQLLRELDLLRRLLRLSESAEQARKAETEMKESGYVR